MIVFKKIRWLNLLSTGNVFTEVSLNTHNHTLIVGENGAGKSTILDALSFVLYGKPFRKVNKSQLINSINNKGLLVECEFQVGNKNYLVRRGAKPNVFEVYQDNVMINLDASVNDYQDMLDKHILKLNHKSFSQIVVLGSASFVPFMQLSAAARREVIEDILDIQIFSVMNTLLKDKAASNRTSIVDTDYALQGIAEKIELEKAHIKDIKTNIDDQIKQKRLQIQDLVEKTNTANAQIQQAQAEVETMSGDVSDQEKVRTKLERVRDLARQIDLRLEKLNKETQFFTSKDDCPTCRQGIAHEHKSHIIEKNNNQIVEIESGKEKLAQELIALNARLSTIADINAAITIKNREVSDLLIQCRTWDGFIKGIEKEITVLESDNIQVDANADRLTELKDQLKIKLTLREGLTKQRSVLDVAGMLLKDSGIKTKIIRQYIPIVNKLINKYLASMDFFVNFELNESFEETIKSRFRDEFSYPSFSEGEKSRIDLALLFTWRAISKLRNSASTNLLILDEVFDGSLDAQGNEELLKIIQTITEGNNVFVISHKTDTYIDKFERVLKFEKQKNFSKMVEL